jgi:hypothetical protein
LGYKFKWNGGFIFSKELENDLIELANSNSIERSTLKTSASFSQRVWRQLEAFVVLLDGNTFESEDERLRWMCFIALFTMYSKTNPRRLEFVEWIHKTHSDLKDFTVGLGKVNVLLSIL